MYESQSPMRYEGSPYLLSPAVPLKKPQTMKMYNAPRVGNQPPKHMPTGTVCIMESFDCHHNAWIYQAKLREKKQLHVKRGDTRKVWRVEATNDQKE